MITKYVEFNVICDVCDVDGCNYGAISWLPKEEVTWENWNETIPSSEKGIRAMKKNAKECGWIHKDGKDICPKCQEKGGDNV